MKALAARHGIRPTKSLGQHFLADPNLARAIVSDAGIRPGDRVLEIGPGLGSLTVVLAAAGAEVLAVELDRRIVPALLEATQGLPVTVVVADAMDLRWAELLGEGPWRMVSNLPYHVATPLVLDMLAAELPIEPYLVMVQREVGERLAAAAGEPGYGAPSVRVRYHAEPRLVRRIPPRVFWPEPKVESILVELVPRPEPPVTADRDRLFRVVDEGFAQRRKTMRNALVRLGLDAEAAAGALSRCGIDPRTRAEELGLEAFACLSEAIG